MKYKKIFIIIFITLLAPIFVYASPSLSYKSSNTISSSTTESDGKYSSSNDEESSLIVDGGVSTINNITLEKSGDSSGDNADFYGINAGLLVYNEATLNINGGTITTNGAHANAVFSYSKGTINISDVEINTSGNNSGGIMVTGGGVINATNLTIETKGNSSAAIRSDRGGGRIVVDGGKYTSNGVGSPAIYSTADITVNNAKLVSNVSSGVVIEGDNSITLNNTTLIDSNTKSNSKGEEANYKNIFIYQSTSGDASEGTGVFKATSSNIITDNGDTIFVTNTNADITLENNSIVNNDENGVFLKVKAARWGKEGKNGGIVKLTMINQNVEGDIVLDNISTLDLYLLNNSKLTGSINSSNEAKEINVTLSSDSVLSLTGDTYVNSLSNEDSSNSNIYLNGYKLYVNGEEINGNDEIISENITIENSEEEDDKKMYFFAIGTLLSLIIGGVAIRVVNNKR